MPRLSSVSFRKRSILLTEENEHEVQKRFRDPTNKRAGTKYGAFGGLVNELLARHFRENPVVTAAELEAATQRKDEAQ